MSNTPNYKTRINLHEMVEKRRDEASIVLEIPDGEPIIIPPPELWTVAMKEAQTKLRRNKTSEGARDEFGIALLGADEWARWCAAVEAVVPGGIPGEILNAVFLEVTTAKQGVAPGE